MCEAFAASGYKAATVWGDMSDADRRNTLSDFTSGKLQILVNVAVLTEGFDHPPTSCVILLRPSSFKSTMIQMIGRGLRIVDPKEHPDIIKKDCIILDFGTSTLIHGSLEMKPIWMAARAITKHLIRNAQIVVPMYQLASENVPYVAMNGQSVNLKKRCLFLIL